MLCKDEILAATDLETSTVDVPEWGGAVCIRQLNCEDFEDLFMPSTNGTNESVLPNRRRQFREKVCVRGIVGPDGGRMFEDDETNALRQKSFSAIDRVATAILELSAMGEDATEELEKN